MVCVVVVVVRVDVAVAVVVVAVVVVDVVVAAADAAAVVVVGAVFWFDDCYFDGAPSVCWARKGQCKHGGIKLNIPAHARKGSCTERIMSY